MKKIMRTLKSIGAALLVMILGSAAIVGFVYTMAKLSDKQFAILFGSVIFLGILFAMSSAFYLNFGPKPPAPPETK